MTPDINGYSSRPEARPVPYWKHPKRAKEAIKLIFRALKTSAENVTGSKGIEGDLSLDTNRASRIFFVSGEPGSGKSTLYLTLRAMLNPKADKTYSEGYPDLPSVAKLQGLVRLLDPIDLEVAGDEGENLLAAVLVRIIEVLDKPDAASKTPLSEPCKGAIKELEELATDIGIAWEGNLKARAGELDPDTYSVEVMRTQRARLRVNERLSKALNELANHKCYDCDSKTLFVLPVDDFYLKPDASLQLLRLLRMISIPRLFFLVMGDINTVEALFIEKSLADWTAVAGTRLFPHGSERLDQALTRARELRARYLRKLLPPGQREVIEAMDWYEALNFEVGRPAGATTEVETLQELLARVNLDTRFNHEDTGDETKTASLLTFLVSPSLPPLTAEEKQKREKRAKEEKEAEKEEIVLRKPRAAYTALQILDATPREILDLGAALREVTRKKQERDRVEKETKGTAENHIPLLLSCIRDIVNLVREEHSFLNEKWQEVLGGVLPTRTYSPEDVNFQMNRLALRPSARTWKAYDSEKIWVRNHRSWDLTVIAKADENQTTEEAKDPFAKLPPRPAAWFVLLHDLAWKWNQDSVSGNLVMKLSDDMKAWEWKPKTSKLLPPPDADAASQSNKDDVMENAIKQFLSLFERFVNEQNKTHKLRIEAENTEPSPQDDFLGWAVWGDQTRGYKHFPMPDFELVRDVDRFLFIWSRGVDWLGNQEVTTDKVISLWKLAGRVVLLDSYNDAGNGGNDWYKDFAEGGDKWFKDFAETPAGSFKDRFDKFSKTRGNVFDYPSDGSAQIEAWRKQLEAWDDDPIVPNGED